MFGTSWGTCLATERHCRAESSHLQIDDDGTFQEIDSQAFLLVTKSLEHLLRAGDCCYIIFPNAFSKVAQPWPTKQYERRKWICTQTYLCGCPVPSAPKYDSDPCFSHSTQMYRNSLFPHFFVTEEDASRCTRSKVVRRKKKKRNQVFGRLLIFLIALFSQLLQEKSSESDTRHRKETIQLIMLSWKDSVAFCTHFHLHDFDAVSCNFSPWWKHAGHGVPSASSSTHAWIDFS